MNITPVYKVVQKVNDRYFSVNPLGIADVLNSPIQMDARNIIEYQLDKVARPFPNRPAIFVVETLRDARNAVDNYGSAEGVIMKGIGQNVKRIGNDFILGKGIGLFLPTSFRSSVCDWFLPLEIIQ